MLVLLTTMGCGCEPADASAGLAKGQPDTSAVHGNRHIDIDAAVDGGRYGFELTQANNLQRQERVQHECETHATADVDASTVAAAAAGYAQSVDDIGDDQLEHLLVDEKHRFLYCYVPKVRVIMRWCRFHNCNRTNGLCVGNMMSLTLYISHI